MTAPADCPHGYPAGDKTRAGVLRCALCWRAEHAAGLDRKKAGKPQAETLFVVVREKPRRPAAAWDPDTNVIPLRRPRGRAVHTDTTTYDPIEGNPT